MNTKLRPRPGATGSEPQGNKVSKLKYPQLITARRAAQAVHCGDRAAPINAADAHRRLLARSYIPDEPRRPTLADIEKMLATLPYGCWVCVDGRVVLFNRNYSPIWERLPDGTVQRANPQEWIDWTDQFWFGLGSARYEKSSREAYRQVLRDFFAGKPLIVKTADEM